MRKRTAAERRASLMTFDEFDIFHDTRGQREGRISATVPDMAADR